MILKNTISICTILVVLVMGTLGTFIWQLPEVQAQTQTSSILSQACPIDGTVRAEFQRASFPDEVGDSFSGTIQVTNDTGYVMSGVKVAVAAYKTAADKTPVFWTVLSDSYQLRPSENLQFPVELSLATLPAGEYILKVFAMQGDETAVLGAVIRDVGYVNGFKLIKSTVRANDVTIAVTVNDKKSTGQILTLSNHNAMIASIKTINDGKTTPFTSQILGVITQGEVPLGAAVREEMSELILLTPEAQTVTEVIDNYVERGVYTIYAGLIDSLALQPFVSVPIQIADTDEGGPWAYISKVGLSDYPLQTNSTVVACVEYTGAELIINRFLEPLAVEFTLSSEGVDIANKHVTSIETGTRDYFSFTPQVATNEFGLTVDFLQERYRGAMVQNEDGSLDLPETLLSVVDTINLLSTCSNPEVCGQTVAASVNKEISNSNSAQKSAWFYAGISLASLLLMYIMLRRLEPKKNPPSNDLNEGELE